MFLRTAKHQFDQACSEIPDTAYELRGLDCERCVPHACVFRKWQSHSLASANHWKSCSYMSPVYWQIVRDVRAWRAFVPSLFCMLHEFQEATQSSKAVNHRQQEDLDEFLKDWRPSLQLCWCGSSGQNELQVRMAPLAVWYANPATMTNPWSETSSNSYPSLSCLFSFLIQNSGF